MDEFGKMEGKGVTLNQMRQMGGVSGCPVKRKGGRRGRALEGKGLST